MQQALVWQSIQAYKIPILEISLAVSLTLLSTLLRFPALLLHGLLTYIQPDNAPSQNGGVKAAIRRPSDGNAEPKPRKGKSKEKFEFDENQAQIFRLKLDEGHLQSRLYFKDYWYSFTYSLISLACLSLHKYLAAGEGGEERDGGAFVNGSLIPAILILVGILKLFVSLGKVSFERSASKRSEKRFGLVVGVLGFVLGFIVCSGFAGSVLDFDLNSLDGYGKFFIAFLMGCIGGFLYMAAGKNARSFWIGTDQTRSNLSIISCGGFAKMILYGNYISVALPVLLWIRPLSEILYKKDSGNADQLVGRLGFARSEFVNLRIWSLVASACFQLVAIRPNLQMFLNEAVLSWYQRLHASRVPDLDFSRAKVFLHNHFLCLVGLQFFAPPILVLLFLGLSLIDGNSVKNNMHMFCGLLPCSAFTKEVGVFMAWWVVFVWTVFTSISLLFYRRGTLSVS
ncbi:unnamed protein product [Linum tenue]|uniref:Transmembrane protein 161B n=1 Tax=Linum tenue TaxID=586396 RepID=A0AAV0J1B1_9ROSI|nr:unnamed protein product [Linum tenue]